MLNLWGLKHHSSKWNVLWNPSQNSFINCGMLKLINIDSAQLGKLDYLVSILRRFFHTSSFLFLYTCPYFSQPWCRQVTTMVFSDLEVQTWLPSVAVEIKSLLSLHWRCQESSGHTDSVAHLKANAHLLHGLTLCSQPTGYFTSVLPNFLLSWRHQIKSATGLLSALSSCGPIRTDVADLPQYRQEIRDNFAIGFRNGLVALGMG